VGPDSVGGYALQFAHYRLHLMAFSWLIAEAHEGSEEREDNLSEMENISCK